MNFAKQLNTVEYARQKLDIKYLTIIEKAAKSDNPEDIIAASNAMAKIQEKKSSQPTKAFFIDPLEFNANLGYKDKPFSLTYTTLKRMAGAPIINSIIKTRKNQIADFAEPQADRYSTGFVVRKKAKNGVESKMDEKDKKIANAITDFVLNCGSRDTWTNDDFDTFIRKIVEDSLIYDQMTFECIRNRRGQMERFIATDASTFRMADTAFHDDYVNPQFKQKGSQIWYNKGVVTDAKIINGFYPQFVQIYQNAVVNEFYPWELCFAVRNPSTSIYSNGYGHSELEELIQVITSMLWGDEYNRRFFSQGSAPKGLLRIKGGMNDSAIQQFKQQWQAMISGVMQSWKTPVVEADVDWIDLQKNNRDMEYSSWMEYLIKIACAVYCIDPSEIGWDISRGNGNSGLFEKSDAERIQNSKDKGLYPLLKFIQRKINKYIVEQINPEFEFVFMGLNGKTIEQELEMDIKKLGAFQTVNEVRQKWDLPEIEVGGDVIENSVYFQAYNQAKQQEMQEQQQQEMMSQQGGEENYEEEGYEEEEENPFESYLSENNDESEEEDYEQEEKAEKSLFVKAFEDFLAKEEQELNK